MTEDQNVQVPQDQNAVAPAAPMKEEEAKAEEMVTPAPAEAPAAEEAPQA